MTGSMGLPRAQLIAYRLTLAVTVAVISYIATAQIDAPELQQTNDKLLHLLAFGALALLLDFSFPQSGFGLRKALILFGYGLLIEVVQYFIPYRELSFYDLLADATGIALYRLCLPLTMRLPLLARRWQPGMT
jgi:VanZ family protein